MDTLVSTFTCWLSVALSTLTIGCGHPQSKSKPPAQMRFFGAANHFTSDDVRAFDGQAAIENSLVRIGTDIVAFFDPAANGSMHRASLGQDGHSYVYQGLVYKGPARFSYVFEHAGVLYCFVTRGDVYRLKSLDGGWTWIDEGKVLAADPAPSSVWHQLWNVGVDVDDQGVWHMLVEASDQTPNQKQVGLTYATSTDGLNWTKNPVVVLPHGGNPFLKFVPGEGLLVLYGVSGKPSENFESKWHVSAATFDGTTWMDHVDKFNLGSLDIDVCDPHLIEVDGNLLMTVSYGQDSIVKAEARNETFESLFRKLK